MRRGDTVFLSDLANGCVFHNKEPLLCVGEHPGWLGKCLPSENPVWTVDVVDHTKSLTETATKLILETTREMDAESHLERGKRTELDTSKKEENNMCISQDTGLQTKNLFTSVYVFEN